MAARTQAKPLSAPNYITPSGIAALRSRYNELFNIERPKIVEVVSWAAGNGDRSENGDYIYGRKKLREIDGELNRLSRKLKDAVVIDPGAQPDRQRVFFGASVTVVDEEDQERQITIVGADETAAEQGRISWKAPLARALHGARIGDVKRVELPGGAVELEIVAISYPAA